MDGKWWNENSGTRTPCPVVSHLRTAADQVTRLHAAVHEAAHNDETAMIVAMGATGYSPDWVEELDDDDRRGMLQMGRMAIEALAEQLDRDPSLEARARAVRDRLSAAGLE